MRNLAAAADGATSRRSAPEMLNVPVAQESIAPTNCLGERVPEDERGQRDGGVSI